MGRPNVHCKWEAVRKIVQRRKEERHSLGGYGRDPTTELT